MENQNHLTVFSKREMEILELIQQQLSSREIAQQLYISLKTVETHRRNLMMKAGARKMIGVVQFALQRSILPQRA